MKIISMVTFLWMLFIFLFVFGERLYSQNTRTGTDDSKKLFQVKGKGFRYILLNGDTAYYETKQPDKVSYFTDLDTLVRSKDGNSNMFYGTKSKMIFMDSVIRLSMDSDTKKKEISFIFLPATTKQIVDWNISKNRIRYLEVNGLVNKALLTTSPGSDHRKSMEYDWQDISKYILTLNHEEFDSLVANFKNKYSIK